MHLRLNIEQYEYMPGPHSGAGLLVAVHDPGDVPKIKQGALSVMPGTQTSLGIQTVQVKFLLIEM